MAVFVGVSKNASFLSMSPGQKNFWCVGGRGTSNAKAGDILLLYFTASSAHEQQGIAQIYRIVSDPQHLNRSQCYEFNMAQVNTELVLNLRSHITFKHMRTDRTLSNWTGVRCNMQGITFPVNTKSWDAMRALIISRNPETDAALQSLGE